MHVGMSEIYRERDDLDAATQHLLRSKELGEFKGWLKTHIAGGLPWLVSGRPREIWTALSNCSNEAERLYYGDFSPNVRPIAAMKARVWVAQGRLGEASRLGASAGACPPRTTSATCASSSTSPWPGCSWPAVSTTTCGPIVFLRHGTARAPPASRRRRRAGWEAIEILVLQALAHQALGDIPAALAPLERALTLAEPEGYVRMFVDEG
jgi:LuxR family transcriptional regulator, maltose regulon positive regulatory protein